eukprot:TRINITY_DN54_c1_g2_i1.p1 TRINITY_DN54_c1_g2~~TRINITY_DN54_c1_g2_i1.p1  ORF type:complete len:637 (+),score=265.34 TRINITY_DN54_c1_g2_i1:93-2003(+)
MRSLAFLALCSAAAAHPFNQYKAQNLHQKSVGMPLSDLKCNMMAGVNASNIDTLKLDPKFTGEIAKYTCGTDRGIFVLQRPEYEGLTFSCADFPLDWCATGSKTCDYAKMFNDNKKQDLMDKIDLWFEGVFNSSIEKHPADCTFDAYGAMSCPEIHKDDAWKTAPWVKYINNEPIRGVNIGGLFVLEPWINPSLAKWGDDIRDQLTYSQDALSGGKHGCSADKLKDHWATWYTQDDFDDIKNKKQLNTVRLPLGWWYFAEGAGIKENPYVVPDQNITDPKHPINAVLQMIHKAGLKVVIDLHGAPCSQNGLDNSGNKSMSTNEDEWGETWLYEKQCMDDTHAVLEFMAEWIVEILPKQGVNDTVIMFELVNEPWVFSDISLVRDFYFYMLNTIRAKTCKGDCPSSYWTYKTLPLLFHDAFRHFDWAWLLRHYDLTNVFMDTHLYHAFNIADIASDNEGCDRQKITITENIACQYDGLLMFKHCTSLPVFVGEWSLAVDNCMGFLNGSPVSKQSKNNWNAGQCHKGGAAQHVDSPWWQEHYNNFANRQIYTFERQLGWTFWTWKVDEVGQKDPNSNFWSFSQAFGKYITLPYGEGYMGGCDMLESVPDCIESNSNKTITKDDRFFATDLRNMKGRHW